MLSGDDLAKAITDGGSNWMILSVAAVLPIIWGFTLSLHFARPYVLRFLQSLTLRFGGDVWWLSYVLTRDALLVVTLCLSVIFLFPNVYLRGDGAGITAPLATLVLFWATLVKLIRDPDDSPSDFRLMSLLLVLSSALYIIPQIYGMEAADQNLGAWSSNLISVNNLDLARGIMWVSFILFGITSAAVFVRFLLVLGKPGDGEASLAEG